VVAVCTSPSKGTPKEPVSEVVLLENFGLEGDAHAGFAHRQVSLLALESIRKMEEKGLAVAPGSFAENLTVRGLKLEEIPVGQRLRIGRDVVLEVSQIGKECHRRCAVYYRAGDCVMPREGIFAVVVQGGTVRPGDEIILM
jgi:MOSC domain-containing protein YiiM